MEYIETTAVPPPNGHYAQAVRHGGLLYVSGLLPIDPETRAPVAGFDAQVTLVLDRLAAVLEAGDSALGQLLQLRIYLVGVEHWPALDGLIAARLGDHRPARAVVPVPGLHYGCLVEVEAIAIAPDQSLR